MNKEDILARSRAEQNDEGMRDAEEKGRRIGIRAFCLVELIVLIFNYCTDQPTYVPVHVLGLYRRRGLSKVSLYWEAVVSGSNHFGLGSIPPVPGLPYFVCSAGIRGVSAMDESLVLRNRLREARMEKGLSQSQLAQMVGVSRNTISSIETGQFNPTAKLALVLCIALDRKFEDLFYFDG